MKDANAITEEFVLNNAVNASAVNNGKKISKSSGFKKLCKTENADLIFGECSGSGKNPYYTSVDFSGNAPVFRCSCPSRQIPCKHCLGIMFDWLAGKTFTVEEVPEDIKQKRDKIAKKAEKAESGETVLPKQNKSAAAKKLKKQLEGLELAEKFVNDILSNGICSVTSTACVQYRSLAKQLGDYYLPEPQSIMYEIISASENISSNPDDDKTNKVISLCVRLASSVRKSRDYINKKLESGEVLPENSILYEAMGGVWKLTQLKEIGLFTENVSLIQLYFTVIDDSIHMAEIDTGYWIDINSGEIYKTENIRPYRATGYIQKQDSSFDLYKINELYLYPGSINRRVRWENYQTLDPENDTFRQVVSKAETISEAVKKAKNELKNTLSQPNVAVLIKADCIEKAKDGHIVLKSGEETIELLKTSSCRTLESIAGNFKDCAVFGLLEYNSQLHRFFFNPCSVVTDDNIVRL